MSIQYLSCGLDEITILLYYCDACKLFENCDK